MVIKWTNQTEMKYNIKWASLWELSKSVVQVLLQVHCFHDAENVLLHNVTALNLTLPPFLDWAVPLPTQLLSNTTTPTASSLIELSTVEPRAEGCHVTRYGSYKAPLFITGRHLYQLKRTLVLMVLERICSASWCNQVASTKLLFQSVSVKRTSSIMGWFPLWQH